jgi:PadR family transcriptional regulator PadR
MRDVRVTVAVARVLREFVTDASEPRYGYELMQLTGFPSGKLYPILARLQQAGWVSREREHIDTARVGRPARYLYRLTPRGAEAAWSELTVLTKQIAPAPAVVRMRQLQQGGGIA